MVLRTYNNQLGDIQIKKQHSPKLFSSSFRFLSKRRTNFYSLYGAHKGLKAVKSSPQTLWVCGLKCGQGPHLCHQTLWVLSPPLKCQCSTDTYVLLGAMPLIKEGGMAIISIGFYPPLGDNTNKAGLSPALLKANRNNSHPPL
jgi:hypothetical protein